MGSRRDAYEGVASHYDRHGWDWYAQVHGDRLLGLIEERGLAGARILDAGCGTGTLALKLSEAGHRVTGIDLSPALLERARGKPGADEVEWHRADITEFELEDRFDLVTCVADTLNHLESLDDWEAALRCFARCTRPGGRLFVDAITIRGLERMSNYTVKEREDETLIVGLVWEPAARRSTLRMTTFSAVDGGPLYERASATVTEWGQPVAGIEQRLARAGWVETERVWPVASDAEEDDRLTLLARRP